MERHPHQSSGRPTRSAAPGLVPRLRERSIVTWPKLSTSAAETLHRHRLVHATCMTDEAANAGGQNPEQGRKRSDPLHTSHAETQVVV
ncbi:hypothetical protein SUDANB6_03266 [Streptomyces sp. enrichment culture]